MAFLSRQVGFILLADFLVAFMLNCNYNICNIKYLLQNDLWFGEFVDIYNLCSEIN